MQPSVTHDVGLGSGVSAAGSSRGRSWRGGRTWLGRRGTAAGRLDDVGRASDLARLAAHTRSVLMGSSWWIGRAFVDDPVETLIGIRERLIERAELRATRTKGGGFMPWPPC